MEFDLPKEYKLRAAQREDLDVVMELLEPLVEVKLLLRRTIEEVETLLPTGFVAEYHSPEATKCLVGFCAVEVYSKKLAEIQCLGVDKAHRSRGLGGLLVQRCVELAREHGVMEVMAISSSEEFLRDLGFDYSLPQQKRALFYQLRPREE